MMKNEYPAPTMGAWCLRKIATIDGKKYRLVVWDISGMERFKYLTKVYYRGAHGAIFTYNVCNYSSFVNVKNWLDHFNDSQFVVKMLVGTRYDLKHNDKDRQQQVEVQRQDGLQFATENKLLFVETTSLISKTLDK